MAILLPTEKNIKQYAVENYVNKACLSSDEFWEDFNKIKYVKRLLNKYVNTGDLKERLILNHLITLGNVFPIEVLARILFLKMNSKYWSYLKTFLIISSHPNVHQLTIIANYQHFIITLPVELALLLSI